MRLLKIEKRPGTYRTVCAPDAAQKTALRSIMGKIEAKARAACPDQVLQGFTRGRSPVTNAKAHMGYSYTLCFDLADFFDTVTLTQLKGKLSKEELDQVLIDPADGRGLRAMQGLPTSPAVANLAASDMDKAILRDIHKSGYAIVYTRYADDLTFSFNALGTRLWLLKAIPAIVTRCGFQINERKTQFQVATVGRRIITGVSVGDSNIRATRDVRRRIRAAKHQAQKGTTDAIKASARNSLRGLQEWAQLKSPRALGVPSTMQDMEVALALKKHWRIKSPITLPKERHVPDQEFGNFIITHDPAYMLGMSTFTTGWTSCLAQPQGGYRECVAAWLAFPGSSVAALLSDKLMVHGGIERRVMRARALVHAFENGKFGYDRVYGDAESVQLLTALLQAQGFMQVYGSSTKFGPVKGLIPGQYTGKIYLDSLVQSPQSGGFKLSTRP